MQPKPDTGETALYRQLFIYLEQMENPVRLRTPGAELNLILETLLFKDSSSYIWSRWKIQSDFGLQEQS